jgi:branched-chain amino acid transport system permease protein
MNIDIETIWQGTVNGFSLGWIYILMALGLTLIFGIMNIMQLAHGEIYMIAAYIAYYFCINVGINYYVSMVISMIIMALCGVVLEVFFFRRVRDEVMAPIVISVSFTLILQSSSIALFGLSRRILPRIAQGSYMIFGSASPADRIIVVGIAILLVFILYIFLKKTKYGQAMVASAQNYEGALLQGISSKTMAAMAMAIACILAAGAGVLTGSLYPLTQNMGAQPLIKGLVIIVIGGAGSLIGTIIGGIFLGFVDALTPLFFGTALTAILPLIIVIAFLLIRPQGLFGHD